MEAALLRLRHAGYRIICHTSRDKDPVKWWLERHELDHLFDEITSAKVPAEAYFDDRAHNVPRNQANALDSVVRRFLENGGRPWK